MGRSEIDGVAVYITQGDANEFADAGVVQHNEVYGKVIGYIPYLGFLLNFVKTLLGFVLLVIVPALLVIIDESKKIVYSVRRKKRCVATETISPKEKDT